MKKLVLSLLAVFGMTLSANAYQFARSLPHWDENLSKLENISLFLPEGYTFYYMFDMPLTIVGPDGYSEVFTIYSYETYADFTLNNCPNTPGEYSVEIPGQVFRANNPSGVEELNDAQTITWTIIDPNNPSGVENNASCTVPHAKCLVNGRFMIRKGEKMYNADGAMLK